MSLRVTVVTLFPEMFPGPLGHSRDRDRDLQMRVPGMGKPTGRNLVASLDTRSGRPHVLIARTVFGKGVSFMEDLPKWHGVAPSPEELETALKELA